MQNKVIDISASGVVESMHQDFFNLGFLGAQKIERASEIIFKADTQKWVIQHPTDVRKVIAGIDFDSYNVARDFEVEWMNECRILGIMPFGAQSMAVAQSIRVARSNKETVASSATT